MDKFSKTAVGIAIFGTLALTGCGSTPNNSANQTTTPSSSTTSAASPATSTSTNPSSTSTASTGTQTTTSGGGFTAGLTDLPFPPQNPTSTTLLATSMPGYKLYMNTCTGCHGQDLEGSVGPELRGLGNVTTSAKLDKFITTGKEGMPPGGELSSPVQIQEVADWLAKQTQK